VVACLAPKRVATKVPEQRDPLSMETPVMLRATLVASVGVSFWRRGGTGSHQIQNLYRTPTVGLMLLVLM
jgi:hypothetical protein